MILKRNIIFCLFFLVLAAVAYGGQASKIELTDGSVINGEVIAFANGFYTINTPALGAVRIESAKVSKIQTLGLSSSDSQPGNLSQSQIDTYRQKIMDNPGTADVIKGLATDPQIQDLAKDPQIQEAAKSGDIQSLLKSEKFMRAVNDPKLQEAVKKLKQ